MTYIVLQEMNILTIKSRSVAMGDDHSFNVVDFFIDGLSIKSIISNAHPGFMKSRDIKNPEGLFTGIVACGVFLSEAFYSAYHPFFERTHRACLPLMSCSDCGEFWCGAVWTRIQVTKNFISWSGLGGIDENGNFTHWPGSGLWIFDRAEYTKTVQNAQAESGPRK